MTDQQTQSAFSLTRQDNGIAILIMDVPGESMNTLKQAFGEDISTLLDEIEQDASIKGVVLVSGKDNSFVAGADISMLDACTTAKEAQALAKGGQDIFNRIENMRATFVAAIHGPALGGGLELAMACHYRVCTDSPETQLGLPEVQLGLLPGSGGTQRLPKLVGVQQAIKMMLTGASVRPKQAKKYGIVDEVVPPSILLDVAQSFAQKSKFKRTYQPKGAVNKVLEGTGFGKNMVLKKAGEQTQKKTRGNYPAPERILDVVTVGLKKGFKAGLEAEAKAFGELVMTPESEQLRRIFFATTAMKKESGVTGVVPENVERVGVLGGGLMGGGIAFVSATKASVAVRIKDIQAQGIANAMKYTYDLLNKKVKRRFIRKSEMQKQMARLTGTLDYSGMENSDIVVEAVFEDLALKQSMVKDIEANCKEETIFASNTSSIPITDIANNAQRPEKIIGLHYFSPVDKMPLAEVIAHEKTSEKTISTTVEFAKKQGKTPVVVRDGAGFYVNRILAPYINEAASLILAGEPIEHIDNALCNFGFPVGPIKLLDEVGIDVGTKIIPFLVDAFGTRFVAPDAFSKVLEDDRKGKKNKRGFYDYAGKKPGKDVDESIYNVLGVKVAKGRSESEISERCVLMMLNEAARCLDEGVIRSPRDGDIGAIFGIGFPPFLGGPFRYIDSLGVKTVVGRLNFYADKVDPKFKPAEILLTKVRGGGCFY